MNALEELKKSITELDNLLVSEIEGKKISNISKLPFKVVSLIFSLHHRAVDLAKNSLSLFLDKHYLSAAILIRSLMETTSLVFLAQKKINQVVESNDVGDLDDFLMKGIFGSRIAGDELKSVNILTAIDHTDKIHDKYRDMYDELSEFAHPNWLGVGSIYSKNLFNGKVQFGKNIDISKPDRILLTFLTTTAVLLISFNDLSKNFDEFVKIAELDITKSKE